MSEEQVSIVCRRARKKVLSNARHFLKAPLRFAEPIKGVALSEISYYGFTTVTVLNEGAAGAISLSTRVSSMILPMLWNYLDATCAVVVGLNQLLDEDSYRQKQNFIKGVVNITSGLQMFIFSYNPAVVAALGVSGAPALLAAPAFALSTLADLINATIDLHSAYKEQEFSGWMEERQKEYEYTHELIQTLENENATFVQGEQQEENRGKISKLQSKLDHLETDMLSRAKVNSGKLTKENKDFLSRNNMHFHFDNPEVSVEDRFRDTNIQSELDNQVIAAKDITLVKFGSFIAMSMIATVAIAAFIACPASIVLVGVALSAGVAAIYLHRHQKIATKAITDAYKEKISDIKQHEPSEPELTSESDKSPPPTID